MRMRRFGWKLKRFIRSVSDAIKLLTKITIIVALFIGPTIIAAAAKNGNWIFATIPTGIIAYGLSCVWEG